MAAAAQSQPEPSEGMINLCMAYEQRTLEALTKPFILPVTIVTGFLGVRVSACLPACLPVCLACLPACPSVRPSIRLVGGWVGGWGFVDGIWWP